jgi:glycosyltransferase involved in cell wall biosynthesis
VAGLNTLISNPARVAEWGRAGRETVVKKFSMTHVAEQHLALFAKIGSMPS